MSIIYHLNINVPVFNDTLPISKFTVNIRYYQSSMNQPDYSLYINSYRVTETLSCLLWFTRCSYSTCRYNSDVSAQPWIDRVPVGVCLSTNQTCSSIIIIHSFLPYLKTTLSPPSLPTPKLRLCPEEKEISVARLYNVLVVCCHTHACARNLVHHPPPHSERCLFTASCQLDAERVCGDFAVNMVTGRKQPTGSHCVFPRSGCAEEG